jgi:hypothetical protein
LLDVIYGFVGFKVPRSEEPWADDEEPVTVSTEPGGQTHG